MPLKTIPEKVSKTTHLISAYHSLHYCYFLGKIQEVGKELLILVIMLLFLVLSDLNMPRQFLLSFKAWTISPPLLGVPLFIPDLLLHRLDICRQERKVLQLPTHLRMAQFSLAFSTSGLSRIWCSGLLYQFAKIALVKHQRLGNWTREICFLTILGTRHPIQDVGRVNFF